MLKKIYILPETKIEEYIVLNSVMNEVSKPNTNVGGEGEGGEPDLPPFGAKERDMEYGNIW